MTAEAFFKSPWVDAVSLLATGIALVDTGRRFFKFLKNLWAPPHDDEYRDPHKDPFFVYYFLPGLWLISVIWITMRSTSLETRIILVYVGAPTLLILTAFGVLWRKIQVDSFARSPNAHDVPLGFWRRIPNLFPYFVFVPICSIVVLSLLLKYVLQAATQKQLGGLIVVIAITAIGLGACRVWWQWVNTQARDTLREKFPKIADDLFNRADTD